MKILFMDDDKDRYLLLRMSLPVSVTINYCTNVVDAQDALVNHSFDLIMLDHDLGIGSPGGDGIELCKFISRNLEDIKWKPDTNVVIHSMNPVGASNMIAELAKSAIPVRYIPGAWSKIEGNDHIGYHIRLMRDH